MTPNYTKLRKAAEAATPGAWSVDWYICQANHDDVKADKKLKLGQELWRVPTCIGPISTDENHWAGSHLSCDEVDVTFITLANPSAILALLDEREKLLTIAEAAEVACKVNFSGGFVAIRDALKEWKK